MRNSVKAVLVFLVVLTSGCAHRALTSNEGAFLGQIHKGQVDYQQVAIRKGFSKNSLNRVVEKALAEEVGGKAGVGEVALWQTLDVELSQAASLILARPEAVTVCNDIYYLQNYADDFLSGWPRSINVGDASLLAHEMTHVWQYQNRGLTGYSLVKVIAEHLRHKDPYAYSIEPGKSFLDYRYEQQGAIVQRYAFLLFVNTDPAEFQQLERLIKDVIPLQPFIRGLKNVSAGLR
jgi:hypothetical protein